MKRLPTDQIVIVLPGGYRYADEDEVDIHLNLQKYPNAVWVTKEFDQTDLAIPNEGNGVPE